MPATRDTKASALVARAMVLCAACVLCASGGGTHRAKIIPGVCVVASAPLAHASNALSRGRVVVVRGRVRAPVHLVGAGGGDGNLARGDRTVRSFYALVLSLGIANCGTSAEGGQ